jgi:MFS family permease
MLGDQVSAIAMPLVAVLALDAHATQMGYLTALQWLPSLLFGLHAGVLADRRGRRRRVMIVADLGRAALLATVPACYALGVLTIWQLYAVTFATGTLAIFFNVSTNTLFVSIVRQDQYVDGQSLLYGSRAMSFVAGPSAGGLLVQMLSAPFAVVADALSFLGSAFFLSRIRPDEPPADDGDGVLTSGARFIARNPIVRASLYGVAVINFFNLMFSALFTLFAVRTLHVQPGVLGLVLGAGAAGGVLGVVLTKRITNSIGAGLAYVAGCFGFTVPLLLVPLAHGPHADVLVMLFTAEFCSGFGVMVLDISIGAIFSAVVPDGMQSRVMGAFQAANFGTRPLGALLGGLLGSSFGLRPALWVAAAGGVIGAAVLIPSPLPRYQLPSQVPLSLTYATCWGIHTRFRGPSRGSPPGSGCITAFRRPRRSPASPRAWRSFPTLTNAARRRPAAWASCPSRWPGCSGRPAAGTGTPRTPSSASRCSPRSPGCRATTAPISRARRAWRCS